MASFVLLGRVFPGPGQHTVVEERNSVDVVAGFVLLGVLLDGVILDLFVDLQLFHAAHRNLDHHVDDAPGGVAVGVELEVMPGRDGVSIRVLEVHGPGGLAEGALGHEVAWSDQRLGHHARVPDPLGICHVLVVLAHHVPSTLDHESVGDARLGLLPVGGDHVRARRSTLLGERAHGGPRDGQEVALAALLWRLHLVVLFVVVDLGEGQNLHLSEAWRGLQHVAAVVSIVEVAADRHLVLVLGPLDSCGVAAGDEEASPDVAAGFAVPLYLGRAGVDHRRRPDGHDGVPRKHAFLDDDVVLVDPHVERHVVVLGPASEGGEPEERLLVPHGLELAPGVLHEEGVARVSGVARLEGVNRVGAGVDEFLAQLGGGEAVLVESVVVLDRRKERDFSSDEVAATVHDDLDVRVVGVVAAEQPSDNLLLSVLVDFGVGQHGDGLAGWGDQGDRLGAADDPLARLVDRKHHRHRHVDTVAHLELGAVVVEVGHLLVEALVAGQVELVDQQGVEVERLQQDALAHEALERRGPALADALHPLEVDVVEQHLGELGRGRNRVGGERRRLPVHASIRRDQSWVPARGVVGGGEDTSGCEGLDDGSDFLLEVHLVAGQANLRS
mmetsp:Transcript_1546/g.2635  ORF Transcript_1546/g.2635 Transcript_1546/m.2635 type:complete len:613 (+) Transcript_1546:858-2696(+)